MTAKHSIQRGFLVVIVGVVVSACATKQPLISHAHVGHALTSWHDTPGKQGLMDIAKADLDVAWREANLACAQPRTPLSGRHLLNIVNALLPEAQAHGPGSGYGALRAMMGTIEHLEYAATSPDASLNLVASVATLTMHGETVHAQLVSAAELAQSMPNSGTDDHARLCQRLLATLDRAIRGESPGKNGRESLVIGFDTMHTNLLTTLAREANPSYAPVPRRYLLGLVRLPSGEWQYRLPKVQTRIDTPTYGNYGY